jgi:hypothetical protein
MLKDREGKAVKGAPITAKVGKLRFEEAATERLHDDETNGKRSLATIQHRIAKHLKPFFGGRRMSTIGTADIARGYSADRSQNPRRLRALQHRECRGPA